MAEKIISPGVFTRENDKSLVQRGIQEVGAAIVGPTVKGNPMAPTVVTSYSEYLSVFGDVFKSGSNYYEYFTSLAAKEYFQNGGQTLLVTRIISGSANISTYATANVAALNANSSVTASFTLETLAWGDQMNNTSSLSAGALASGSVDNVRYEITNVNTGSGLFTLVIRRGDDNNAQPNILETWANLSLDPQLPNYVSRVIGDLKPVYNVTNGFVNYTGSFANASQYVRVASVTTPNVDSIDNNGFYKSGSYSGSLPNLGSGSFGGSFAGGVPATTTQQLMNEILQQLIFKDISPDDYLNAFTLLTNQDEYQFNILLAPGVGLDGSAADNAISCVESRGDAIAIVDNGVYGTSLTAAATNAAGQSSNYGATYYPWVQLFSYKLR
jgi:hypothetical protein